MPASRTPKPQASSTPASGAEGSSSPASSGTPPSDGPATPPGVGGAAPPQGNEAPTDRRLKDERRHDDRRQREEPVTQDRRTGTDRRQVERRAPRNINAYDLGADELELINAVNAHKARTGRAFPTWSEMLGIVRALGYEKRR